MRTARVGNATHPYPPNRERLRAEEARLHLPSSFVWKIGWGYAVELIGLEFGSVKIFRPEIRRNLFMTQVRGKCSLDPLLRENACGK